MKDLLVIYSNPTTDRLKRGFHNYPKHAVGVQTLLQTIVKNLLNILGTNHFSPGVGSSLLGLIGQGYNPNDDTQIRSIATLAVSEVEDKIKEQQADQSQLQPEEQLESLTVRNVSYDPIQTNLYLDIAVKTKAKYVYLVKI